MKQYMYRLSVHKCYVYDLNNNFPEGSGFYFEFLKNWKKKCLNCISSFSKSFIEIKFSEMMVDSRLRDVPEMLPQGGGSERNQSVTKK